MVLKLVSPFRSHSFPKKEKTHSKHKKWSSQRATCPTYEKALKSAGIGHQNWSSFVLKFAIDSEIKIICNLNLFQHKSYCIFVNFIMTENIQDIYNTWALYCCALLKTINCPKKKELILRKLNFIQMKTYNDITCNWNSNSIEWNANGCRKIESLLITMVLKK